MALVTALLWGRGLNRIFLLWNLFLAALPVAFCILLAWRHHRGAKGPLSGVLWVLWLLFYPNAPYMVTDWIHLTTFEYFVPGAGFSSDVLAWVWFFQIFLATAAGWLLGGLGLAIPQALVKRRHGKRAGWAFCGGVCLLCGIALYLGRVLRFNSWDALLRPGHLLAQAAARLGGSTAVLCLLFAAISFVLYGLFYLCFYRGAGEGEN